VVGKSPQKHGEMGCNVTVEWWANREEGEEEEGLLKCSYSEGFLAAR
jgi:hypothetical protein